MGVATIIGEGLRPWQRTPLFGQGCRRHRHPDTRRSSRLGQRDERALPGVHAQAVRNALSREGFDHRVVITSAKKTFFAAGPHGDGQGFSRRTRASSSARSKAIKSDLRTLGPSAARRRRDHGAALGGGLESALACHHACRRRQGPRGRPSRGDACLLPGGGGVTRTVRMFGHPERVHERAVPGPPGSSRTGQGQRLVDELVGSAEELVPAAKAWIKPIRIRTSTRGTRRATRCRRHARSPALAGILPSFPRLLRKQLKGAPMPAPRAILDAAVEGAQVDFRHGEPHREPLLHASGHRPGRQRHGSSVSSSTCSTSTGGGSRPEGIARRRSPRSVCSARA